MAVSKRRRVRFKQSPRLLETQTNSFHNDKRPTYVLVNNKIYTLQLTSFRVKDLLKETPRPHFRALNLIKIRNEQEQAKDNVESDKFMTI